MITKFYTENANSSYLNSTIRNVKQFQNLNDFNV